MALGSAFVDRARIKHSTQTEARVEGTKQYKPSYSRWFRCRLQMVPGSETGGDGRRRKVAHPTMMIGRKAQIGAGDEVEIDSKQLGRNLYQVTGQPDPIRKRRIVIGYEARLSKVS